LISCDSNVIQASLVRLERYPCLAPMVTPVTICVQKYTIERATSTSFGTSEHILSQESPWERDMDTFQA